MNTVAVHGDKRMTVREVAEVLGVHYDTVASHVKSLFPALVKNGVTTYLNETQVTAVKLKIQNTQPANLRNAPKVHSVKTSLEKALLIQQAMQFQQEIIETLQNEKKHIEAAYGREVLEHKVTKAILEERETGLSTIQRIAEAGGLILSDRDDVLATYRR